MFIFKHFLLLNFHYLIYSAVREIVITYYVYVYCVLFRFVSTPLDDHSMGKTEILRCFRCLIKGEVAAKLSSGNKDDLRKEPIGANKQHLGANKLHSGLIWAINCSDLGHSKRLLFYP